MRVQGTSSAEHSVLRDIRVDPADKDASIGTSEDTAGRPAEDEQTTVRVELEVPPPLADVALVVVHGMGRQAQGQTLLEWAEPILGRVDWLTKRTDKASVRQAERHDAHPETGADEFEPGVAIVDSVMRGANTPHVLVEAKWRTADLRAHTRTIAVVEARWSESFVPMSRAEVFRWGVRFLWRSLYRMFRQFFRTMVGVPWLAMIRPIGASRWLAAARSVLGALTLVFGFLLTVAVGVVMTVLGAVMSVVLPLLSPLLLIPIVKKFTQSIVDVLVDFVGDVGTFREKPLRAAAMRVVVHDALAHAHSLIDQQDGEIAVLAHSQGAAISAVALFHELDLSTLPVRRLATVGAAITLLGKSMWDLAPTKESYKPISNWAKNAPTVSWDNYWAIWDPFSAGPIGDSSRARRDRWRSCYRAAQAATDATEVAGEEEYFPAEHAVHNTSMPFTDHQTYALNIVQVVEPIAIELLGPAFPPLPARVRSARNTRVARLRRARGALLVAALIIAILLPTQNWFLTGVSAAVETVLTAVRGTLLGVGVDATLAADAFYTDTETFTVLGTVLLVALTAAVLLWLIGWFTASLERCVVWDGDLSSSPRVKFFRELVFQTVLFLGASTLIVARVFGSSFNLIAALIPIGVTVIVLIVVHSGQIPEVSPGQAPPGPERTTARHRGAPHDLPLDNSVATGTARNAVASH